jgi:hypothetical protein
MSTAAKFLIAIFLVASIFSGVSSQSFAGVKKSHTKHRHVFIKPKATHKITPNEATAIAVDAYIYGYPLITMEMTRRVMTNVKKPKNNKAPMGQIFHFKKYPTPRDTKITTPNADLLCSSAFLDLTNEPYVFSIPDVQNRYYIISILDAWSNVFQVLEKRAPGNLAQQYALVGPTWHGKIPPGIKIIKSPTNIVWILGRIYCNGQTEDYAEVSKLQAQLSLIPLSFYGKDYNPPKGIEDSSIDMKTPVREQVNQMDVVTYFNLLAKLMSVNPPLITDTLIVAKMAKIGITPGHEFNIHKKLDQSIISALQQVPQIAQEKIIKNAENFTTFVNGWFYSDKMGVYGTSYLKRAYAAMIGLGANRAQDAIYLVSETNSDGKLYDGASHNYIIHFTKGQIPPVNGFWSLTIYNDRYLFVRNSLKRYSLHSQDHFNYNQDGSLDLYIQKSSPGKEQNANWLPAPNGKFILILRLYWPKQAVFNGFWVPPAIKTTD